MVVMQKIELGCGLDQKMNVFLLLSARSLQAFQYLGTVLNSPIHKCVWRLLRRLQILVFRFHGDGVDLEGAGKRASCSLDRGSSAKEISPCRGPAHFLRTHGPGLSV